MNREELRDKKLKEFFQEDKIISDKANKVFDDFSKEVLRKREEENIVEEPKQGKVYKFKKLLTIAATLMIVILGSNVYATSLGYNNIFFMIKEIYTEKTTSKKDEIFSDRDIIISYQSFYIIEGIEMQINELQVKDNEAKLYLFVKEDKNNLTPFNYKVYNDKKELMCNKTSDKENKIQYTETLNLKNYYDDMDKLVLEVYSNQNDLLKTVDINLTEKIIEAKSEAKEVSKISQIELNQYLKRETLKSYDKNEVKDKQVLILKLIDITYSDSIYIVKYLYCMPTEEDISNGNVENLDIYVNTVQFLISGGEYKLVKIDKPDKLIFEK